MNRESMKCTIAAILLVWLWPSGNLAVEPDGGPRQEIAHLAELTHWKAGTIVADVGAGDGAYSFEAAEKVGPAGRVYATEIDAEKLKNLKADAAKRKLDNVIVVEGTAKDTRLPPSCCDMIFLRRVYHHLTEPQEFDRSLVQSLKPGGYLAIIDFPPDSGFAAVEGVPENRGGHGIPKKLMIQELTGAALRVEKVIDHWTGHDYCVIFVKRSS